jgi:NTE family protein
MRCLYLITAWHYSVLTAGLALTPAPIFAAVGAAASGRIADRYGQRVVAAPAVLLFALGSMWLASTASEHPDFVGSWLPGAILSGVGVGAGLTAFSSAAAASLPAGAFAVGGAINVTARQIGAVLGVAILVAIVGVPASVRGVAVFQHSWVFSIAAATLACLIGLSLGRAGGMGKASAEPHGGPLIQGDWA